MKRLGIIALILMQVKCLFALDYPMQTKTLANGLKIIVCEKKSTTMAQIQVWYRVGSKDEWDGIRGMAHLFEHMMFRGSKNFTGENKPFKVIDKLGGEINAYTTFDRTVYHEELPGENMKRAIEMEADRMENLILDQNVLNTEREVVGEELRLGENSWYQRFEADRYKYLYPDKHPYKIDVIGNLEEITAFTTQQCQEFYDKYYSPNNAFVVITGNVNADEMFSYCEQYFGGIKKQLPFNAKKSAPDLLHHNIAVEDMSVDFPVQIYSYIIPSPEFGHPDYYAFNFLSELLFSNSNSLIKKRIVNHNMAYSISGQQSPDRLYPSYTVFDVVMQAGIGNAKVKKEIAKEINEIITDGIDEVDLKNYLSDLESKDVYTAYSNTEICGLIGMAEYYYQDYNKYNASMDAYRKLSQDDLKRVAKSYFDPTGIKVINTKPKEVE